MKERFYLASFLHARVCVYVCMCMKDAAGLGACDMIKVYIG